MLGNDTDPDGDTLTLASINGVAITAGISASIPATADGNPVTPMNPIVGTVEVSAGGVVTFIPALSYTGPVVFDYSVSDGNGGSDTVTVTGNINGSPMLPTATNDTSSDNVPGSTVTIDVVTNDFDPDGVVDPTSVQIVGTMNPGDTLTIPGQGAWSVNPVSGAIAFTPEPGFNGNPAPIQYTIDDAVGNTSAPASVSVGYDLTPPSVTGDVVEGVPPGSAVTINVLGNDGGTGVPLDPSSVQIVGTTAPGERLSIPGEGVYTVNRNTGAITFTPAPGFVGEPKSISYTVANIHGIRSAAASVEISMGVDLTVFEDLLPDRPTVLDSLNSLPNQPGQIESTNAVGVSGGIVTETARTIGGQSNEQTDIHAQGIVLQTVNQVDPLNGFTHPMINKAVTVARVHDVPALHRLLNNADRAFDLGSTPFGVESLTGYSLRIDVVDLSLGSQEKGQIIVDTLVRDRVLYVEVSNSLGSDAYGGLKRYQVLQADGKPLPPWVHQAENGLLLGEVPADTPLINLLIVAEFNDGATIEHNVDIQTASGEVSPVAEATADYVPTFSQQVQDSSQGDVDALKLLGQELKIMPEDGPVE